MSPAGVGGCPPAETLLEFVAGSLTDDRAATVESHIDDCIECRAAISNLARGDTPPSFGRYRIDTVLGSGGMGIVYRAWDPELARAVAIKVVRRAGDDAAGRARLVREAQSLAKLSHPHVCHVYDVGTDGDEVWVAMELIEGATLRQWAEDRRDVSDVLRVLLGAAEGLAAAHEAGLVHRDVKPENVLVTRDGRAIVTDFGLARVEDRVDPAASTLPNDPKLTATGAIAGTPAYLAPEQLAGDPIDARVDQFAWGVMAWEMLTGARPFPVIFAVRMEAIRAGVTPPPTLAPAVAAVLTQCMAAAPRDRFATMREVVAAIAAAPEKRSGRAKIAAAIAASVLLVGGVAVAWQDRAASRLESGSGSVSVSGSGSGSGSASVSVSGSASVSALASVSVSGSGSASVAVTAPATATAIRSPHAATAPRPPPPRPSPSPDAGTPQISVATSQPPAPPPAPTYDSRYSRSRALAVMAMQCTIPYDFAHTKSSYHVADWGKVTSVTDEHGDLGGRDVTLRVITIQGQRRSYRCPSDLGALGVVEAKPGDLLAVCAEDKVDTYQLAAGPIDQCRTVIPISQAPRSSELASLAPHHVDEMAIVVDAIAKGKSPKPRLDPSQRYLVWAAPIAQDGTLWRMDRYWLEVPSGIPGAELVAAKQRRWFVIAHPRFENDRFIVTAARVIDELFP